MIIRGLWWALYKFLYFTKWAAGWTQNGTRQSYMFAAFFPPDLSHVNIQEVKTHTVGNYAARPVLKDIQLEL